MLPRTLRIVVILVLAGGIIARAVGVASSDDPDNGKHSSMPAFSGGKGTLFFDATYHPGSLAPWWKTDVAGKQRFVHRSLPDGIAVVSAPRLHGVWAAKFSVSPATSHVPKLGGPAVERTELAAAPGDTVGWQGRVTWYSWAMYFPRGFQSPAGDHSAIVDQVKRVSGRCGSPNLVVAVNTKPGASSSGVIRLKTKGGFITDNTNMSLGNSDYCPGISSQAFSLAPFRSSHWFFVLLRVAWSPDPSVGAVTAWVNGCSAVPFTHVTTLYSNSDGVYWRQGLYERAIPVPESDYQLGVRVGTSAASVTRGSLAPARPRNC